MFDTLKAKVLQMGVVSALACAAALIGSPAAAAKASYAPVPPSDAAGPTMGSAHGPLAPGTSYPGAFSVSGQVDWYYFYATPNTKVVLTLTNTSTSAQCTQAGFPACGEQAEIWGHLQGGCPDDSADSGYSNPSSFECVTEAGPGANGTPSGEYAIQVNPDVSDDGDAAYTLSISSRITLRFAQQTKRGSPASARSRRRPRSSMSRAPITTPSASSPRPDVLRKWHVADESARLEGGHAVGGRARCR